ncbi:MAG: molybdopterin-dependent oxidoreductase, partial [Pseudomonadota bacterium]
VEAMFALKELVSGMGGTVECRTDGAALPIGNRSGYAGTATIEDIDSAEMIQLVGTNPRAEAPVLNARLRKAWLRGAQIGLVGEAVDLTYDYAHVGTDTSALQMLAEKEIGPAKEMETLVIVGQGVLSGPEGAAALAAVQRLCENSQSKLLVLHTAASRVGAMDVGFATEGGMEAALDGADVVYNLGADEVDIAPGPFVIYQGSHGDRGAHRADVILPGAAYTEESGLFVNTEGRPQMAARAGFPPGAAKENWAILRALSAELGATLPYNSLAELRAALFAAHPVLAGIDQVPENEWQAEAPGKLTGKPILYAVSDHYQTNPIARASEVMAELSKLAAQRPQMAAE